MVYSNNFIVLPSGEWNYDTDEWVALFVRLLLQVTNEKFVNHHYVIPLQ